LLYRIILFGENGALGSKPWKGDEASAIQHAQEALQTEAGAMRVAVRDNLLKLVFEGSKK
jgi:hypothetical protein